jgi:hypothetical protein
MAGIRKRLENRSEPEDASAHDQPHSPAGRRWRQRGRTPGRRSSVLALSALAVGAGLLSSCGSSGSPHASAAVKSACQQVSAVLSDGPDPGADPVGYAEAQVLPLRQIRTADQSLQGAIDGLASAYQQFSSTNGTTAAKHAVSRASEQVNAICPGAAS